MTPTLKAWLAEDQQICLLAEVGVKSGGTETTRYLSNAGYVSGPSDTPANTIYAPRLVGGFSFSRSLNIDSAGGSVSFGELQLDNTDGALDGWVSDIWAMRTIRLYVGSPSWPRASFEQVFSGVAEDIRPSSRGQLALRLRDVLAPLQGPISTAKVGGTGDNKDTLLPIALGECFNVEPLLLSSTGLATYRASLSAVEQIVEVRDNGYPVTVTTSAGAGTLTLLYARYGQITCDVQGAKVLGAYRNDVGGLVEWAATTIGDGQMLDPSAIDSAALSAFRSACPQPVGMWIADQRSRIDVMQELAASVGATVSAGLDGKLRIVRLAFGTPTRTITPAQMMGGTFEPVARPAVKGAVRLSGCRNWAVQNASSLAAALEANQVDVLTTESAIRQSSNPTTLADYKQGDAPDVIDTLLVVESDIDAEAARRQALWGVPRTVFRCTLVPELMDIELGETVTIQHPRLGLSAGAPGIVTRVDTNFFTAKSTIEVLV